VTNSLRTLLGNPKMKGSRADVKLRIRAFAGGTLACSASPGKYQLVIAGGTSGVSIGGTLANTSEWTSINSVFDEFFCHSAKFHYRPVNRYSANSSASTGSAGLPGNVNTCGVVWTGLQGNQAGYTDSSTAWVAAAQSYEHKFVELGSPMTFTWKNRVKFDPNGVMDITTGTTTWMNVGSTSAYGGLVQAFTPEVTGASAGIGVLTESGVFGHVLIEFDVSLRCRS